MNNTTTVSEESRISAGFRLRALELRNWGTFDGDNHYVIDLGCESACLTGLNGSGKSTIVDALLTLLVPHDLRSYNVAATGSGAKRERSISTYIRGAWAKEEDPENSRGQLKYLRKPGNISVLLAVFHDAVFNKSVTLAQLHWITAAGEHQLRCLCKEAEARINDLGIANLGVAFFKEHFTKNGWSYETTFEPYQGIYTKLLRIPADNQALKLFCRTVSVKDVPSVTEFIRSLMLEPYQTGKALDGIITHFGDLDHIHTQLEETRKEIELLKPIREHYNAWKDASNEVAALAEIHRVADVTLASDAKNILQHEIDKLNALANGQDAEVVRLAEVIKTLDDRILEIQVSLKNNSAYAAIEEHKRNEAKLAKEHRDATTQREHFLQWLEVLGQPKRVGDERQFAEIKSWVITEKSERETQRENTLRKSGTQEALATTTRERAKDVSLEIQSLAKRRDKIPEAHRHIRAEICAALKIDPDTLPFAGELMDVPESEAEWRGSLEMLLHGFALSVLVPDEHYRRFSGYVDTSRFKRRLVYYRVPKGTGTNVSLDASRACGKIVIRPNAWCRAWLQERLYSDFSHYCAPTMEDFWKETGPALTRNLHVRGGGPSARHSKETEFARSDYDILGWSNAGKIESLRQQLGELEQSARKYEAEAKRLVTESRTANDGIEILRKISEVSSFRSIDTITIQDELTKITDERVKLEESDETIRSLNQNLRDAEADKKTTDDSRLAANTAAEGYRQKAKQIEDRKKDYVNKTNASNEDDFVWENRRDEFAPYCKGIELTFENLTRQINTILKRIADKREVREKEAAVAENNLHSAMAVFLSATQHKGYANEWQRTTASAPSFIAHLESLEGEKFHNQQEEFNRRMRKILIDDINIGDGELKTHQRTNIERIGDLNETLRSIDYNTDTFVQIVPRPSREIAVVTYQAKLAECTRHMLGSNDAQLLERFSAVKALVTYIRDHRTEAEKGANPNNWDAFAIAEYKRDQSDENPAWHPDGGGNSGGQKAKLACTILAAAMAFQFHHTRTRESKAFRFVMVDEIFSKSDDVNSVYALSIFKKFDFQLLLVTPRDGRLKLVQPYVGSFHLVQNPSTKASSIINMTSAEVEAECSAPASDAENEA